MDRLVEDLIRQCRICATSDRVAKTTTAPVASTPWPERPWEKLAVDVRGPDGTLGPSNRFALVIMDYHSKWAEVELMPEVTARAVADMFRRLLWREGVPGCIVSDNGPQFTGREFAVMCAEFGIRHQRTPVCSPISNGLVERFNRSLSQTSQRRESGRLHQPRRPREDSGAKGYEAGHDI